MTRAELLQDRAKAYQLRCAEAAYDAVLDHYLPGFVPSERMSDDGYLLSQKLRFHKLFSDSYVNYLAGEVSVPDFPESLKALGADTEWQDLMEDLRKVNAQPIPVYDEGNHKALSEGGSVPFQLRMQESVSSQQVFFAGAPGEIFSFDRDRINGILAEGGREVDATGRVSLSSGTWSGFYQPWKRAQADRYIANVGPLVVNEFLKGKGELPLSVSECMKMHDYLMDLRDRDGRSGVEPASISDVYDAFLSARHYPEGEEPPAFSGRHGFEQDAEMSNPIGHGSFLEPGAMHAVFEWLNEGEGVTVMDFFGTDSDGLKHAHSSYIQAFLNPDVEAQAKVLGLTPAVARRGRDGSVYYESATQELIPESEAYAEAEVISPNMFPVVPCDKKGVPESGPQAKVYMTGIFDKRLTREGLQKTAADQIGFPYLRPYLRKEVYANLEGELEDVIADMAKEGKQIDRKRLRQAVRNGAAVLDELDKRGLRYEVKPDLTKGQLTASVDDPMSMQFRVMDLQFPEYIGRAYYSFNNTTTRFSNDGEQKKGADGKWHSGPVEADEAMTRDLVAYALGEPVRVKQPAGGTLEVNGDKAPLVGSQGSMSYVTRSGMRLAGSSRVSDPGKTYHASYVKNNGKGFAAIYSANLRKVGRTGQMTVMSPVRIANDRIGEASKNQLFYSGDDARDYIRSQQEAARTYLETQVLAPLMDVKDLGDGTVEFSAKPEEALLSAQLSEDPAIRALQQQYITYLTTDDMVLRDLDSSEKDLGTMEGTLDDIYTLEWMGLTEALGDKRSKEEHIIDSLSVVSGQLIGEDKFSESGDPELSLNFANVAKYGGVRETDLMRAIQAAKKDPDGPVVVLTSESEEATMNRIKERVLAYNPETGRDLKELAAEGGPDSFYRHLYQVISDSMTGHGVEVSRLEIDDQGIVHYQGVRQYGADVSSEEAYAQKRAEYAQGKDYRSVDGQIGQIFAPDDNGVIVTRFDHDDNYAIVPGYTATVHRGEGSVESRTVCHGYQQMLDAKIRTELHQALSLGSEPDPLSATSVNRLYRHLYDERYPADYRKYFEDLGMSEDLMKATIATQRNIVRYDKRYIEESTLNARVDAMRLNLVNDAAYDGYSVTGRDLSVMGWSEPGYFDNSATQSSTGQGISRCLVSGAKVDDTGHIVKSPIENDRAPILMEDFAKNIYYNPFDRRVMVYSNLMHCLGVTGKEQTAHMTLEGWTMDDAYVISKDFAERHKVPDGKGGMRPLKRGDKICDMNGNKGVLSLVVDPEMDLEEARKQKIEGPVKLFKNNPELSVVGSPFTAPSRMNGGTARDMMDGLSEKPLILADGREVPGALGSIHYIITDKTVDEKTHQYGEEDVKLGKGRSVSSQMLWSLQARNATELVHEFFGNNVDNLRSVREKMIVMGMDLDKDYRIVEGYTPHELPDGTDEVRPIIDLPKPPADYAELSQGQANAWKADAIKRSFGQVARNGGFLRIPFQINTAAGQPIEPAPDGDGYLLPLMPPVFRSEQAYDDNTAIYHDYTQYYGQIAEKAVAYYCEDARPVKDEKEHAARLSNAQVNSQRAYDNMAQEIRELSFDNKWNDWKKRVMSHKMPQSFTAVGVPDPRLDLDEVAMSNEMAQSMGLSEGEQMLLWRDPLLRPEGIAYMTVHIDDSLEGIALNPAMDKRFDGDFDGDAWGGLKIQGEAAKEEAARLFSARMTMIDLGTTPDEYTKDDVSFALNMGLDIASAKGVHGKDPADIRVQELLDRAKDQIAEGFYEEGFESVNQYVHERLAQAHGSTVVRYDSMKSHLDSVCEMVNIGAKGKPKGVQEYADWLGVEMDAEVDENAKQIHVKSARDLETAGLTDTADDIRRKMLHNMDTQVGMATAIKSFGTGRAGSVSQHNVGVSRKDCPESPCGDAYLRYALETTYGATQGILQAKHDAKEALQKYKVLTDVIPVLYSGRAIVMDENGNWKPKRNEYGGPVWNTKKDFVDQYAALCESKTGLNFELSRDNIEMLANCLYDGNTDAYGRDRIRSSKDRTQTSVATIDHLAYAGTGCGFDALKEMMGRQLFNTPMSREFAPRDPKDPEKFASLAAMSRVFETTKLGRHAKALADLKELKREYAASYHVESTGAKVSMNSPMGISASKLCEMQAEYLEGADGADLEQGID